MENAWVSPSISHSTGKCNKTFRMGWTWKIGTHTFPIVWVIFPHTISILPLNSPNSEFFFQLLTFDWSFILCNCIEDNRFIQNQIWRYFLLKEMVPQRKSFFNFLWKINFFWTFNTIINIKSLVYLTFPFVFAIFCEVCSCWFTCY